MNQLVTIIAYLGIVANLSVEPIHIMLYSIGPLRPSLCYLSLICQLALTLQLFLLLNAVMTVRFVFTFYFKNPTAAQHDFWTIFITLWTFLIALFASTAYFFSPGRDPIYFFVCVGAATESQLSSNRRINYIFLVMFALTIIIHVIFGIKIKLYELKISTTVAPLSIKSETKAILDKNRIITATINLVVVLIWIVVCLPVFLTLKIEIESINQYPNYLLVYYLHLVGLPTYILVAVCIVLFKNRQLRAFIRREVSQFLQNI